MALGILSIIYGIIILTALIVQVLLYKVKNNRQSTIIIINGIVVFVIFFFIYTSLPTNFILEKIISFIWPIMALVGFFMGLKFNKYKRIRQVLLSISIIGSLVQLFI